MSQHPFQSFMIKFRAGEMVFRENDPGTTMFIVHSGKIRLFRDNQGDSRNIGVLEKGDFFGEMSILEALPRTNSAEVVEDAELIEINSMIFDKMIRGNIEIAVRMLRKLSLRLREAEQRILEFQASGARPVRDTSTRAASAAVTAGSTIGVRLHGEGGRSFAINGAETLIGRYDPVTELKPDIDLTDLDLKRSVSRRHARVVGGAEGYAVIEEVGALNGTFVNGARLVAGQAHPIVDGDRLEIGTVPLIFHR